MKALSLCGKNRQIRPILKEYGIAPNRFYILKSRYMLYGIWGLIDRVQKGLTGEKISPELELQIIEERLISPALSTNKMIKKLDLKCSKANVQKIYSKWELARFKKPVPIRGVISHPVPVEPPKVSSSVEPSAKTRFPNLIETARLKVNLSFERFAKCLSHRKVLISNPGAIIASPFLDQLGVVETLHTYGPESFKPTEITNDIIINTLRIIAGFPTIHDYTLNSDRSVAIAAGLSLNPSKSRFYDSFDKLRFEHLLNLRNDTSRRAKELGIIEGKQISNALGIKSPVAQFIESAHKAGALVLLDGSQSVPHLPTDVRELDCDFLVFSGHKMLAPSGIGVLFGKRALLSQMPSMLATALKEISNVYTRGTESSSKVYTKSNR